MCVCVCACVRSKHMQNVHDFRESIQEQHAGWQRLMQQQRSLDEDQRSLSTKSGNLRKESDGKSFC